MTINNKLETTFKNIVEKSDVPYILVKKQEDTTYKVIACSPYFVSVITNPDDFIDSGGFYTYIKNLSFVPIGKSYSDTIIYIKKRFDFYGEVLDSNLFLIQFIPTKPTGEVLTNSKNDSAADNSLSEVIRDLFELKQQLNSAKFELGNIKEKNIEANNKIKEVEDKLYKEFKETNNKLVAKIESLYEEIAELNNTIIELRNNSLLKFTSTLDFKKVIAIITLFISILSSTNLLEGYIVRSVEDPDELDAKIERLLELTDP